MKRILELCFTGIERLLKVSLYHTVPISLFLEELLMSDSVFYKMGKEGKAYLFLFSISYMILVAVLFPLVAVLLQYACSHEPF